MTKTWMEVPDFSRLSIVLIYWLPKSMESTKGINHNWNKNVLLFKNNLLHYLGFWSLRFRKGFHFN